VVPRAAPRAGWSGPPESRPQLTELRSGEWVTEPAARGGRGDRPRPSQISALMKALLLALGCSLLYALLITLIFRTVTLQKRAAAMFRLFLATVPLYLALYALTPADLGVLSPGLVEPRYVPACLFGLFVHAALFFGGWLQLYNLADRGFSLRILTDVDESPERALSAAELQARYGGGRGLQWMLDKRVEGIVESAMATLDHGRLRVTPKGARAARICGALRAVLQLDSRQ
jgi:hypothetical protein